MTDDCFMDKEFTGWLHPKSDSQKFNVQVKNSNELHPSAFCVVTNTVQNLN